MIKVFCFLIFANFGLASLKVGYKTLSFSNLDGFPSTLSLMSERVYAQVIKKKTGCPVVVLFCGMLS